MVHEGQNQRQIPDDIIGEGDLVSVVIHKRDGQIQILAGFFLNTDAVEVVRPAAEAKNLEISLAKPSSLVSMVGEPRRLQQHLIGERERALRAGRAGA